MLAKAAAENAKNSPQQARAAWSQKPNADEHHPSHQGYIDQVPAGDIFATLGRQSGELASLVAALTAEQWKYRYASGKWSVLEVVGHLVDAERIQSYRAMHVARGDQKPIPGWEENEYMREARFEEFSTGPALLDQFTYLRAGNLGQLQSLPPDTALRRGTANNVSLTARAAVWVLAGHTQHHINILRERYGLGK